MKLSHIFATCAILGGTIIATTPAAKADDSGCGLGTLIIKSNGKLLQLLALTTNQTTLTNYLGITTGTSGCKASGFVMREKEVQYFAEVNKEDLSREMSQGRGEKLMTLASLYGCSGAAGGQFAKMTQTSFGRILPSPETNVSDMVQNINRELNAHSELAKSCQAI
jgi:hypothetical protein